MYEGMLNQLSHLEVWILDFWRCYDMLLEGEQVARRISAAPVPKGRVIVKVLA